MNTTNRYHVIATFPTSPYISHIRLEMTCLDFNKWFIRFMINYPDATLWLAF